LITAVKGGHFENLNTMGDFTFDLT